MKTSTTNLKLFGDNYEKFETDPICFGGSSSVCDQHAAVEAAVIPRSIHTDGGISVSRRRAGRRSDVSLSPKKENRSERIGKADLPYTFGMIVLDILAPIFLMIGINYGSAANASLLGNFEIVATTMIALLAFRETVSKRLWIAVSFITASSIILSFEGRGSFQFSVGSLFVLLATACWGLENNCTRSISDKSTYEIVLLKGLFSGSGSFIIAMILGEQLPNVRYIILAMLLGFVAYGLSIFLYVRAQHYLGAAKTSAYYAINPFIGSFLSFVLIGESLTGTYFLGLIIMIAGTIFVVMPYPS